MAFLQEQGALPVLYAGADEQLRARRAGPYLSGDEALEMLCAGELPSAPQGSGAGERAGAA